MTYRPAEAMFGPPLSVRVPSFLYLVVALAVGIIVVLGESAAPGSWLYEKVVLDGSKRVISPRTLAILLGAGALASVLSSGMRGVRVRGDGVAFRDKVTLFPRVRTFKWAQIDRILLDSPRMISLELWDGTTSVLPPVRDLSGLARELEKVAAARAIPVKGGHGLDELPQSEDFAE